MEGIPNLLSGTHWLNGGAERDRTVDLLNAIQALSQLSYSPTANNLEIFNTDKERLSIRFAFHQRFREMEGELILGERG
jgi:hypothetical protein